jgi:hypothetical protein
MLNTISQHGFLGSNKGSDFRTVFQKGKGWHCPNIQDGFDGRHLIDIYFEKDHLGMLSRERFKYGGNGFARGTPFSKTIDDHEFITG